MVVDSIDIKKRPIGRFGLDMFTDELVPVGVIWRRESSNRDITNGEVRDVDAVGDHEEDHEFLIVATFGSCLGFR